jgi:molybdopterin synthase sulfur carrier subunit
VVVSVAGVTIAEVLTSLETAYPGIKERLCDADGNIRRFINVFVNDEDVRFLEETATVVKDSDEISIVPAIAGG